MKRFAPHKFKNEIEWDGSWKPIVIIPVDVYKDIHCIVEAAKGEVTWIGTIKKLDDQKYYLHRKSF